MIPPIRRGAKPKCLGLAHLVISLRRRIWSLSGHSGICRSVADVEALRLHYALTLERWREALERNLPAVQRMHGEAFARTWRFYLAGSPGVSRRDRQAERGPPSAR